MEIVKIQGTQREETGKKSSSILRKESKVPCVLYGGNLTVHFQASYNALRKVLYTNQFLVIEIELEEKTIKSIVKDAQFHPVTDDILHVDFQELVDNRSVITEIPVKTTGFASGIAEGGKLEISVRKLRVKALPKNLLSAIEINVDNLALGKSIKVRDLDVTGLEIMNPPNIPVVQLIIPRALKAKMVEAAKEAAE